ncbi:MAG: CHAT domain-containing protein, partial [Microbacterium sp.]
HGLPADVQLAALTAARAWLAAGDLDACRARLVAAGRVVGAEARVHARLVRSELADREGLRAQAQRHRRAALAELDGLRSGLGALELRAGTAVLGIQVAQAGLASALTAGRAAEVFAWAELTRAQSLLLPPVRPDVADADWSRLRAVALAQLRAEFDGADRVDLRAQRDELRARLRRKTWSAAGGGPAARPVDLSVLRARLGERALVAYLCVGGHLHALVVTRERSRRVRLARLDEVREQLLRVRGDLDLLAGTGAGDPLHGILTTALDADAAELSARLLRPLAPLLGDRELVVVPTADLITVPWAVLPAAHGRAVTVAPSATLWVQRSERATADLGSLVLAAGPRLPHATEEVAHLAALARAAGVPATVLPTATTGAVRAALSRHDVVHVACHGHHAADNPLFSGLELADGLLMGYDLLTVARPPRIVVLSACDLGISDVRPGDEALGIATAVLAAGAGCVVASVARTGDAETAAVMADLYAGLLAGLPPARALAAAVADRPSGFVCLGAG